MAGKPGAKINFKPKKHHGFYVLLFCLGMLLPPLAVAARFGIGTDFFINVFLCICGYFPCHFHNFYIQNIRNNTNRARTPKWALRAGLVDDSDRQRKLRKNAWAKQFDERNLESTHVGADLEEGEVGANYDPAVEETEEQRNRRRNEGLWTRGEEEYYNEDAEAPNQRAWHYPANFAGTVGDGRSKSRNTQSSGDGDRWERSRDARRDSRGEDQFYPTNNEAGLDADVPEWGKDYGSKKPKKAKKGKGGSASAWANNNYVQDIQDDNGWGRSISRGSAGGGGRNGTGNGYGNGSGMYGGGGYDEPRSNGNAAPKKKGGDIFEHEF